MRTTHRQPLSIAFSLALAVLVLGIASSALADIRVAATTGDLAAVATFVGGEHANVNVLSEPTEDTHYTDPRPDKLVALSRADLLVLQGLSLEIGWLPQLQVGSRNRAIQEGGRGYFDASGHVTVIDEGETADRSRGDVHPGGNPHYNYDPRRMAQVAVALAEKMGELDPENAAYFSQNAARFSSRAQSISEQARARFASLSSDVRQVVVYHASFPYLLDLLGIRQVATIEPRPGIEPNPNHVSTVLSTMRARGVKLILQESYYPENITDTLARLSGATVLSIRPQTRIGRGETYFQHIEELLEQIHSALEQQSDR